MATLRLRFAAVLSVISLLLVAFAIAFDVSYDERGIKINGQSRIIISGSIHYPRSTPEMWPDLIRKAKEGGLNAIETYVFWNAHEPLYRQYDFDGNKDLVRFVKTIQEAGLYAILRIGPYVCAEWNYGGFPVWLHNLPGVQLRTNNTIYQNEMKTFVTLIVDMMKRNNLFAVQGGPIIVAQIENEYGNVEGAYGDNGKSYVNWCAQLALSYGVDIPWIMCQQNDAPPSVINTCNGWYCDQFSPNNPKSPKWWTEDWSGWIKNWGSPDPHRTPEDLAFAVARFFQYGGSLHNYYMYHGGTNFDRTAGGPYITTSYDYNAPLDEYGNLNQPKWGHLKRLHELIMFIQEILTHGVRRDVDYGNMMTGTVFTYNEKQSCFLGNANSNQDFTVNLMGNNHTVPAWSVSILPDCQTEVYNTAKINSQQSIMVKLPNEGDDQTVLYESKWEWWLEHPERLHDGVAKGSKMTVNELLDQKTVTNDTSDYLWYLTSLDLSKNDSLSGKKITLHVHTMGHIVHAFVNGMHVGSQWGSDSYEFIMEKDITLKVGDANTISLLSVTVGLQNYGANFDMTKVGIYGPVKLIGNKGQSDEVTKDLSTNLWTYKVGLNGMKKKQLQLDPPRYQRGWKSSNLPSNRLFVWYKTTFKSPSGSDPVVVDLQGLGKGTAWVNGQNIGRYWPSYLANEDGCTATCDYRGPYNGKQCLTNCGQPSQRWYHIPRSFLKDGGNKLILFEEFGGTPLHVRFQTVTVGTIYASTNDGEILELSCQGGHVISKIQFASFGEPTGASGSYAKGGCEAPKTLSVIEKQCLGQESCTLDVSENTFGSTGCQQNAHRLAVEATCDSP